MTSLMGMSWNAGLMPYGLRWRKHRRAIHQYFNIEVVQSYQPLQLSKARVLLHRLRDNPSDFMRSIHFAIGAGIIELVYGHPVKDVDNKYLVIARNSSTAASEGLLPGAFFVDFLPILRYVPTWFPGAVFKRKAAEWRAVFDQMLYVPFNDVKADLDGGKSNTSIMAQMLAEASYLEGRADEEDMEVARNISAVAYGAGADTTYSTMQTFFLAMVLHPEVQKKAQAELATVVGPSRLPDFADRDSLPYINAIVKECARWIPVVPLGVPHATSADDEYEGYFIPKGAVVMANQWAILHDPEDYPEPELFKPERFLKDGKLDPDVRDPSTIAFGFGRRICPGRHLSDASVFINVASILHVFDMKPAVDEYGTPKLPEARATSGFFSYPYPFECDVKARSASAQGLLNEMQ
ncbi:hypothetical protein CERSUDRAFT_115591 [Gelatoporia subvermispora B]|uniref:Cytochrome P450 n=1 Tax=Ceriporiopsis subvermispora (strain B) TaxID=914234 RepID=M2RCM8_CERS8|nr:hypothetical protein CERSUDRAFT_115591 [Gelatoporia subvermispora B]